MKFYLHSPHTTLASALLFFLFCHSQTNRKAQGDLISGIISQLFKPDFLSYTLAIYLTANKIQLVHNQHGMYHYCWILLVLCWSLWEKIKRMCVLGVFQKLQARGSHVHSFLCWIPNCLYFKSVLLQKNQK